MRTKYARIGGLAIGGILLLAGLSYLTTSVIWDGGFSSGRIIIVVQDDSGHPIEGAVLHVCEAGSRQPAKEYPIHEHGLSPLVSDSEGKIVCHQIREGLQFGGRAWLLFWVIPVGARAPDFDCTLTCSGYDPLFFSIWKLFESPHEFYDDFPKVMHVVDGQPVEMKVFEHHMVLIEAK